MDSNDLNMLFTTLNAARIMMKNRDRQPHEEAIYTAIQHCQDEVFPRLKADLERARKALEDIVNPIVALQRYAKENDRQLDGHVAVALAKDPEHLRIIARAALAEIAHNGK